MKKRFIRFQFLGIPPKGELHTTPKGEGVSIYRFQFLGIPPKGELYPKTCWSVRSCSVSNF